MDCYRSTYKVYLLLVIPRRVHSKTISICISKRNHCNTWDAKGSNIRQKTNIYLQVLADLNSTIRSQTQMLNSISPTDRWSNRMNKLDSRTVPQSIH